MRLASATDIENPMARPRLPVLHEGGVHEQAGEEFRASNGHFSTVMSPRVCYVADLHLRFSVVRTSMPSSKVSRPPVRSECQRMSETGEI